MQQSYSFNQTEKKRKKLMCSTGPCAFSASGWDENTFCHGEIAVKLGLLDEEAPKGSICWYTEWVLPTYRLVYMKKAILETLGVIKWGKCCTVLLFCLYSRSALN